MGFNDITSKGVIAVLDAVESNSKSAMESLHVPVSLKRNAQNRDKNLDKNRGKKLERITIKKVFFYWIPC